MITSFMHGLDAERNEGLAVELGVGRVRGGQRVFDVIVEFRCRHDFFLLACVDCKNTTRVATAAAN